MKYTDIIRLQESLFSFSRVELYMIKCAAGGSKARNRSGHRSTDYHSATAQFEMGAVASFVRTAPILSVIVAVAMKITKQNLLGQE